jgi:hypothetical protein
MTVSSNEEAMELQPLSDMSTICVDDEGNWHRPEYPRYREALAAPKPFLVPSFDGSQMREKTTIAMKLKLWKEVELTGLPEMRMTLISTLR